MTLALEQAVQVLERTPPARIILQHGPDRPFEPFDREGMFAESAGKEPDDLLDEFIALRAGCLAELRAMRIGTAELAARGTHPSLGPATLGRRYREAIGPWRAHLPVVDRIAP